MKVAVVTGASTGMGEAIAIYFASKGYAVSITARSGDKLENTKKQCVAAGLPADKVVITVGDLTERKTAEAIVKNTLDKLGSIDVLINNAGFALASSITEATVEDFDRQFNLNVRSVHQLTQLALPHIIKSKGNIINISSVGSKSAFPAATFYCMTKSALDMYTKCLALELASKGVRVNSVNPGLVATDFAVAAGMCTQETKDAVYETLGKTSNPMGRSGTSEEIAKTVFFLASPDSSFTTGTFMNVDGGKWAGTVNRALQDAIENK